MIIHYHYARQFMVFADLPSLFLVVLADTQLTSI